MNGSRNQKNIYFITGAIIIAGALIAGALIYTKSPQSQSADISGTFGTKQEGENSGVELAVVEGDHVKGNPDASVTIIEYSDFECPFCSRFHPTLNQVLNDYPNDVRLVYRHFPLDSIHAEARPSAEASECANEQGKFWEFADGLFENQSKLGKVFYSELAQNIGLNVGQFEECVLSRKYKDRVEADFQEGIKLGVTGTPGSFINGELISGAVPYNSLKEAVEQVLTNLK